MVACAATDVHIPTSIEGHDHNLLLFSKSLIYNVTWHYNTCVSRSHYCILIKSSCFKLWEPFSKNSIYLILYLSPSNWSQLVHGKLTFSMSMAAEETLWNLFSMGSTSFTSGSFMPTNRGFRWKISLCLFVRLPGK